MDAYYVVEELWQPIWDFTQDVKLPIPAPLPYSVDDRHTRTQLKQQFRFCYQLCLQVSSHVGASRLLWKDLAIRLGHSLTVGESFWPAIGVTNNEQRRRLMNQEFDEPYFESFGLADWQLLREVFGLPEQGILYQDATDRDEIGKQPVHESSNGYKYYAGKATGETLKGQFGVDAGTSCCWIKDHGCYLLILI